MTLRFYLAGVIFATILAAVAFFLIIWFFSPENADPILLALLFFSLFIVLAGLFSLISFWLRKRSFKSEPAFRFLGISFRQGSLLAMLLAGSLFLRTFQIFWWWSGLILLILVAIIEFLFLRRQE